MIGLIGRSLPGAARSVSGVVRSKVSGGRGGIGWGLERTTRALDGRGLGLDDDRRLGLRRRLGRRLGYWGGLGLRLGSDLAATDPWSRPGGSGPRSAEGSSDTLDE